MKETVLTLWDDPDSTKIRFYPAEQKRGNGTVVIFAGGGYHVRAPYEEIDYALRLNEYGLNVFTVDYRVAPDRFPLPLLDARRAVRFVRKNAERFG
ncbi:MAG: alpha/beta hydrolase fold domain-containing protein, partial [Clostridia bacterium]|nr:alpha/beta hydrolase fold domain-containing protein [Clostridia bacterium]